MLAYWTKCNNAKSAVEIDYNMEDIEKGISSLKGPQLKMIHMEKYITILSIQLLNYAYILLKQGFIEMNRLLDKIPAVNCQ